MNFLLLLLAAAVGSGIAVRDTFEDAKDDLEDLEGYHEVPTLNDAKAPRVTNEHDFETDGEEIDSEDTEDDSVEKVKKVDVKVQQTYTNTKQSRDQPGDAIVEPTYKDMEDALTDKKSIEDEVTNEVEAMDEDEAINEDDATNEVEVTNEVESRNDNDAPSKPVVTIGKTYRFASSNYPNRMIRHRNYQIWIDPKNLNQALYRADSSFTIVPGLAGKGISFRSKNYPDHYLRHRGWLCYIDKIQRSDLFKKDASFIPVTGLDHSKGTVSFESVNYRGHYIRHASYRVRIGKNDNSDLFRKDASWRPSPY